MSIESHPRVEMVQIDSLKPNPRNPRIHSDKQIAQIAASITQFGNLAPIVVAENVILAGHGRWLACKRRGDKEVPVIRADLLTEADRRAFVLADNRIAELSGWNDELLAEELEFLFEGGFELEITGFSTADLDLSVPDLKPDKPEEVELPAPDMDAVSRPGDLWQIGPHRLLCGDARALASWERLLGENLATLVFSDPPYNVPIDGFVSGNGAVKHREFIMGAGEMTPAEHTAFMRTVFRHCVRFSHDGSIHYHCMDYRHNREIQDAADGVYDSLKQLIIWDKGQGGQGSCYRNQYEMVFMFKAGKAKHINNFGLGETGRYRTNIVRYPGVNSFRKGRKRDLADHSTVKPAALVADFLLDCSNRGDLVVDPFLGSGTTLYAAHRTHRIGAGIELDPLYVDTAIRRLGDACKLTAVLDGDGRTFDEVAAARKGEADL